MRKIKYLPIILSLTLILTSCGTSANKIKANKERESNCANNQQIKIAVFPFQNDNYCATDEIISRLYKECFQIIERAQIYRIVDEMKLQSSGITESAQIEIGKILNVNSIIIGSVYTTTIAYIPSPRLPDPSIGYSFGYGMGEALNRSRSGTTLYANYRIIDVRTGRIIKVITNQAIRKISQ